MASSRASLVVAVKSRAVVPLPVTLRFEEPKIVPLRPKKVAEVDPCSFPDFKRAAE